MAAVTLTPEGRIAVTGDLLFDDAVAACATGRALVATIGAQVPPVRQIEVTLAGLARVNSVSAVVLVEWQRAAVAAGKSLLIVDVPPRLAGILRLSGLDEVLPLG